jgi:hypothetical protein
LREAQTFAGVAGSGREATALEPTKPSEARRSRPTAEKIRDFLRQKKNSAISVDDIGGRYRWTITVVDIGGRLRWTITVDDIGGRLRWTITVDDIGGRLRWSISVDDYGGRLR